MFFNDLYTLERRNSLRTSHKISYDGKLTKQSVVCFHDLTTFKTFDSYMALMKEYLGQKHFSWYFYKPVFLSSFFGQFMISTGSKWFLRFLKRVPLYFLGYIWGSYGILLGSYVSSGSIALLGVYQYSLVSFKISMHKWGNRSIFHG